MADGIGYYDEGSLGVVVYDFIENALLAAGASVCNGDVAFYRSLADGLPGPVLDVGTGTGRIAWQLAEAGHEVVGVDRSQAMLALAEAKRAGHPEAVGQRVSFLRQDVTALDLGRTFGLIVVSFHTLNHVLEPDRQRAAVAALRRHLAPGGRIVLHLYPPTTREIGSEAVDELYKSGQVKSVSSGDVVAWRILEKVPDMAAQTVTTVVRYTVLDGTGAVRAERQETHAYRWTTEQEMRYVFELSGLAVEALHGDFKGGPPGSDAEQIWVLRHAGAA